MVTMSFNTDNATDNPILEGLYTADEHGKLIRIGNASVNPWRTTSVSSENNVGALAWIKSNPSVFQNISDEERDQSEGDLSDGVAPGSDEDSDDDESNRGPCFLTCDLCGLVFINPDEAWNHEQSCTHPPNTNRVPSEMDLVFFNKYDVFDFLCKYMEARERPINASDLIYFVKPPLRAV